MAKDALGTKTGDLVVIEGHKVGQSGRRGEILEVLGTDEHPHYRVRWEDGRETIFYPSNDALVVRPTARRRSSAKSGA